MALNKYIETYGTALVYGTVGGTPATALGGIDEIRELPGFDDDEFETTRIDQADRIKQFVRAMTDAGFFNITVGVDKTVMATVIGLHGLSKSIKITFSDGSTLAFDARIKRTKPTAKQGEDVLIEMDLRVLTAPVFTAAA
jgi:hypothetical protein